MPHEINEFDIAQASSQIHREVREYLYSDANLSRLPAFSDLLDRPVPRGSVPCWGYPVLSFHAEGGGRISVAPAATAVLCQLCAIHLIDDLIDDDPKGLYHRYGVGATANLASALQAKAVTALCRAEVGPAETLLALEWMASMQFATCNGQQLDSEDAEDEKGYWRIARAKTPPLFGFALALGALSSGAAVDRCEAYRRLGESLGLMIQVCDDLRDVLEKPAAADWKRRGSNLAVLYARSGDHEYRERFEELVPRVDSPAALEEAQSLLVRSGAFSYCALKIVELAREASDKLRELDPDDPRPIQTLIRHLLQPLIRRLERAGVDSPGHLLAPDLFYRKEPCPV